MPFIGDTYAVRGCATELWTLEEPLAYQGQRDRWTIPAGFATDFTTVPHFVTWLFPKFGIYSRVAILHDYLCVESYAGRFSRADADGIFRRVLREYGISFPRRWMMWAGCRAASSLQHASFIEVIQFMFIAVPAVVFLLIPSLVLALWGAIMWLIELPWRLLR